MRDHLNDTAEHSFNLDQLCRYFSEHSPLPHLAVEGDTHIVRFANRAFRALVGRDEARLVGHPFGEVVPEGTANGGTALFDRVYRTGIPENLTEQEHGQGKSRYWTYVVWPILGDDDVPVGIMIQISDVTEGAMLRQRFKEMNESLLLGSLRQHERADSTADLNFDLNQLNHLLEMRVEQRTQDLRRAHGALVQVEQREREHLASVLHDGMQQLLVATKMRVSMLRSRLPASEREAMDQLDDLLAQCIAAARTLAVDLFPPTLHFKGLIAGLTWLAQDLQVKQNFTLQVVADDVAEPASEVLRIILFQAAREALLNVVKHAGVAAATLTLERSGSIVRMQIIDEGKGFEADRTSAEFGAESKGGKQVQCLNEGFGLSTVRHRIESHGGTLTTESVPGEGTCVTVTIPEMSDDFE